MSQDFEPKKVFPPILIAEIKLRYFDVVNMSKYYDTFHISRSIMTGNFLEDNQQLCIDTSEGNSLAQDGCTPGNSHEDGWTEGSSLTRDGDTLGCCRRYFWEGQKLQDESSNDVENGINFYRGFKKGK